MGITVTVVDQTSTGKANGSIRLEDIPTAITLGDLIRTRVRDEVARYNAAPGGAFHGLVMPDGAEPAEAGFAMPGPRRIDWEAQAALAIEAFLSNGFFVVIDSRQVTELDDALDLGAESDIRFVRLVQLVGG